MEKQNLVAVLQSHFSTRFHAPHEEGRQRMAQFLSQECEMEFAQAEAWVEELEGEGYLHFVALTDPNSAAMLEAARYGEFPAQGSAGGYWIIGSER